MTVLRPLALLLFVSIIVCLPSRGQETSSWTHFRGDHLNGISSETGVPVSWNDSTNIAWKTAIDGKGWSSPVVLGNQVWLTTATNGGLEMRAVCVDAESGKIIHNLLIFNPDSLYPETFCQHICNPKPCY